MKRKGYSIFARRGRPGATLKQKDAAGRWRMRQFPDAEAARIHAEAALKEARLRRAPDAQTTLAEYAARWFSQVLPTLRRETQRSYAWALDTHILPALGAWPLRRLGRGEIKGLVASLLASGLAKKTVSNVRAVLHACLDSAAEDLPDILPSNPASFRGRRLRLVATRAERRARVKAFTADELQALLEAARRVVPERYPAYRFQVGTGLRPGELLGLQWEDLDLNGHRVLVRRAVSAGRVQATKTGEERGVDLGTALVEEARTWDAASKARALATGAPRAPWIFGEAEHPLKLRRLDDDFKLALKAAKLPPWHTPHHLRHTYATLALIAGESIYYVQRQLGHATITMTIDLYGSWLPAGDRAAADRIESRALGARAVTTPVTIPNTGQPRAARKSLKRRGGRGA